MKIKFKVEISSIFVTFLENMSYNSIIKTLNKVCFKIGRYYELLRIPMNIIKLASLNLNINNNNNGKIIE